MRWLRWTAGVAMVGLAAAAGCGGDEAGSGSSGGAGGHGGTGPICTDCTPAGDLTFALPSPAGATLWTTATMNKVLREAAPPTTPGAKIAMSAAKNEFEPFQIVVHADADAAVTLAMTPFTGPGTIDRIEIRRVGYVQIASPSDPGSIPSGRIPDPLYPTTFGASESVTGGENQPFWITAYVPPAAAPGDYTSTLTVTVGGAKQDVPVSLHVFDFAIPAKIGFDGNWNGSFESLGGSASLAVVQKLKDFFFEHRLVPSSVAWPAGLNYDGGITYDCASGTFQDNPADVYDFSQLGPKYIDGTGWNGVGFPSFQAMGFVDNSTPRPQTFCNVDRGPDHYGTAAYNAEWSKLLAAIDAYLVAHAWTGKGYYYVQNEPQDQADYDLAAFLADLTKKAAPDLRIAISEEPKPEIVTNAKANGHSYDLWWADLSYFEPEYAKTRMAAGEDVWWYFLYGDLPPHFNPITIDHEGIESRIPFWSAKTYGVTGFAYYSLTGWGADPVAEPKPMGTNQNGDGFLLYPPAADGQLVTSIRWELLREGEEDWEYLTLSGCDATAKSAASSTTSFTHDASALQHVRDEIGSYLEKKVNGCPTLTSTSPGVHAKGAYYINFQDPAGQPAASPLSVNGHTWEKIGWEAYDAKKGYGWAGPNIGNPTIMLYAYQDAPGNELQKSIIYDDYGRTDTFNWDIEAGSYVVTVGIGYAGGNAYTKQRVVVEGQLLFDDAATDGTNPYLEKAITVDVTDGNVTLEVGQTDEYTMLQYVMIEPAP